MINHYLTNACSGKNSHHKYFAEPLTQLATKKLSQVKTQDF